MGIMEEQTTAILEKSFMMAPNIVRVGLTDLMVDEIAEELLLAQEEALRQCIAQSKVLAPDTPSFAVRAAVEPLTKEKLRKLVRDSLEKAQQQYAALLATSAPSNAAH